MRPIDADAFKERLRREHASATFVLRVEHEVDAQPTIEAEPVRRGRWIGVEYDGYADGSPIYDVWECSECHGEHYGEYDTLPPYCKNCGAKMDEVEE